ncbi:MAG: RHS repeat-associated core domain-containing protein, partial [Chrysiogenia bacterium]
AFEHRASDIAPIDIAAAYKYDIFGRRLQKNVNNVITNFFWEGDTLAYELNDQYQPIRKYLTTGLGIPSGDSITSCFAKPQQSDAMDDYEGHLEYSETTDWSRIFDYQYYQGWYSYMSDQVGTVYKVYDHRNRRIADDRTYDSFGNLVSQTGTTKTPLGFQGKYYDSESGLNYFYHRYYNPVLGRFISEGPVGFLGGLNLHSFVNNNPISSIDPTGTKTDVNSFPIYIPFQDIKISGSAFSWQSFKEMICGDVKLCKKDSFWDNVWENFRQTNEAIPGILAPGIGPIGLGYLTSSELVEITNRITLMQWAMRGFSGMTLGGASFNAIETGIIAGTTSFANFLFVGAAWESGVFIGSLIRAALCD